eukprot:6873629-Pyramimonas_sp.AAC.1
MHTYQLRGGDIRASKSPRPPRQCPMGSPRSFATRPLTPLYALAPGIQSGACRSRGRSAARHRCSDRRVGTDALANPRAYHRDNAPSRNST